MEEFGRTMAGCGEFARTVAMEGMKVAGDLKVNLRVGGEESMGPDSYSQWLWSMAHI